MSRGYDVPVTFMGVELPRRASLVLLWFVEHPAGTITQCARDEEYWRLHGTKPMGVRTIAAIMRRDDVREAISAYHSKFLEARRNEIHQKLYGVTDKALNTLGKSLDRQGDSLHPTEAAEVAAKILDRAGFSPKGGSVNVNFGTVNGDVAGGDVFKAVSDRVKRARAMLIDSSGHAPAIKGGGIVDVEVKDAIEDEEAGEPDAHVRKREGAEEREREMPAEEGGAGVREGGREAPDAMEPEEAER